MLFQSNTTILTLDLSDNWLGAESGLAVVVVVAVMMMVMVMIMLLMMMMYYVTCCFRATRRY